LFPHEFVGVVSIPSSIFRCRSRSCRSHACIFDWLLARDTVREKKIVAYGNDLIAFMVCFVSDQPTDQASLSQGRRCSLVVFVSPAKHRQHFERLAVRHPHAQLAAAAARFGDFTAKPISKRQARNQDPPPDQLSKGRLFGIKL